MWLRPVSPFFVFWLPAHTMEHCAECKMPELHSWPTVWLCALHSLRVRSRSGTTQSRCGTSGTQTADGPKFEFCPEAMGCKICDSPSSSFAISVSFLHLWIHYLTQRDSLPISTFPHPPSSNCGCAIAFRYTHNYFYLSFLFRDARTLLCNECHVFSFT
jgi:hypothetical protein